MRGAEIDRPVYPMRVVEHLTGLSGRRIRYYEQLGLVRPARTAGGQRLFSPADVGTLLEIKAALAEGRRPATLQAPKPERAVPADPEARFALLEDLEAVRNYFQEVRGPTSLYPIDRREQLIRTIDELRLKDS